MVGFQPLILLAGTRGAVFSSMLRMRAGTFVAYWLACRGSRRELASGVGVLGLKIGENGLNLVENGGVSR